jgi:hypothetical protein
MRYIINIMGTGSALEITEALDEVKQHIEDKVELGQEGDLDDLRVDFPRGASLDKQNFSVLIKLKY